MLNSILARTSFAAKRARSAEVVPKISISDRPTNPFLSSIMTKKRCRLLAFICHPEIVAGIVLALFSNRQKNQKNIFILQKTYCGFFVIIEKIIKGGLE
jgi:hypothetical protein